MKKEKIKEPKDLGLKLGTEEEVFWDTIKRGAESQIKNSKNEIKFQTEVVKICEKKIKEVKL